MFGTEILYSKYRIVLHKMSELDEISDSGNEMYSCGGGGDYSLQDRGLKILMCCIVHLRRVALSLKAYV